MATVKPWRWKHCYCRPEQIFKIPRFLYSYGTTTLPWLSGNIHIQELVSCLKTKNLEQDLELNLLQPTGEGSISKSYWSSRKTPSRLVHLGHLSAYHHDARPLHLCFASSYSNIRDSFSFTRINVMHCILCLRCSKLDIDETKCRLVNWLREYLQAIRIYDRSSEIGVYSLQHAPPQ